MARISHETYNSLLELHGELDSTYDSARALVESAKLDGIPEVQEMLRYLNQALLYVENLNEDIEASL